MASALQKSGFGTLLLDLLLARENVTYDRQFDTNLLAERLLAATRWLQGRLNSLVAEDARVHELMIIPDASERFEEA